MTLNRKPPACSFSGPRLRTVAWARRGNDRLSMFAPGEHGRRQLTRIASASKRDAKELLDADYQLEGYRQCQSAARLMRLGQRTIAPRSHKWRQRPILRSLLFEWSRS
jgi:hypothetical protein